VPRWRGRYRGRHERGRAAPSPPRLSEAERAALALLAANRGISPGARWLVGRATGQALARRGLVVVGSEVVVLTDAGRRALADDGAARGEGGAAG